MSAGLKCISECRQCAGLFRLGRDVEAALTMVDMFDEAQRLLSPAPRRCSAVVGACVLTQMLACQERQDWLGLADFMEYELVDLLESCRRLKPATALARVFGRSRFYGVIFSVGGALSPCFLGGGSVMAIFF